MNDNAPIGRSQVEAILIELEENLKNPKAILGFSHATEQLVNLVNKARVEAATHQRNLVIQQGHNLDCIQCGFKDNVVERYLAEIKGPQSE